MQQSCLATIQGFQATSLHFTDEKTEAHRGEESDPKCGSLAAAMLSSYSGCQAHQHNRIPPAMPWVRISVRPLLAILVTAPTS